ncbi:hypothetical protein OUZ56_001717 [Daphnia magna]|uniref:Uncharacterized protein n=1 Tax=Daphnia magna TaxID=35525 RepID=A0ABR0A415_9CRUS|nr:hypothetical protein OUZ56_001717 [Daphnia magna]
MKVFVNSIAKIHQVMSSALPSSELVFAVVIASLVTLPSVQVIMMVCFLYGCLQCISIIVVLGVSLYTIPMRLGTPTYRDGHSNSQYPPLFLPIRALHVDQFMERDGAKHRNFH